ncbi:hypothetical protein H2199_005787 [Coniosporium tulheliwenetii]|uniref:Uncharacterized protein n=1 Tax=Coniosporium tulheliwenetii TaxID=3383036 RepID=A0ACC2Z075_9PEZI|nr:hypothetical protein H2199_005787 [Cladosporium sp. JES 115]
MQSFVSSFLISFLCVAGALAAPAAAPVEIERRAISGDVLAKLSMFEQWAAASYCPNNNNSPNSKVICEAGNCPTVQAADTKTVIEFQNSFATDVTGFVAVDKTNKLVVVSFRGSQSIKNWLANLNFPASSTDICPGCTAHTGFWNSWSESRKRVLAAVESAADANPGFQLVVTGHSLGGAIANFAAAQLRNDGYKLHIRRPRIGNAAISDYISNQPGGTYRVTHTNDPVPHLAPIAFGFVHISPEYYISSGNNVPVTANDVAVYEGNINFRGNTGKLFLDTDAHGWYFNKIGDCGPDFEIWKRELELAYV